MHFLSGPAMRAFRIARCSLAGVSAAMLLAGASAAQEQAKRPDGLYAEIQTSKGRIVARLEAELTPLTVANFVGLAEGTIANSAFDPGRPFYDGSIFHRVEAGHVIQTGIPQSDRARNPGYTFPNEIHAKLSHNHAGALNMANGGPNTNAAQFCIMLGDRSYLDGDFTVFGEVVEGLDVVMRIARGDVVESVRIARVGAKAQSFHPTTESFRALVKEAEQRIAEHAEKKRLAEQDWIARNYPKAAGPAGLVLTERLTAGQPATNQAASTSGGLLRVRYRGSEVRYVVHVLGRVGPPLEVISFGSGENGVPGFVDPPRMFTVEPGKTKINSGLDSVIVAMQPGERCVVIVPAALGYGRAGLYPPETAGNNHGTPESGVLAASRETRSRVAPRPTQVPWERLLVTALGLEVGVRPSSGGNGLPMPLLQLALREGTPKCRGHAVGGRIGSLPVILLRLRPVAQLLVALPDQALNERIGRIYGLKIGERRLIVASIKCDVTGQTTEIRLLRGDAALVQNGLGSTDIFAGLLHFAAADGDPRPRVRPPEIPEILAIRWDVRLLQPGFVASLIPGISGIPVSGFETDSTQFVSHFAGVVEIRRREVKVVGAAVGLLGALAVAGKTV